MEPEVHLLHRCWQTVPIIEKLQMMIRLNQTETYLFQLSKHTRSKWLMAILLTRVRGVANYGRGWVTVDKAALQAADALSHRKNHKSRTTTGSTTGTTAAMARDKTVTITVAQHEALKKAAITAQKLKNDVQALTQERNKLTGQVSAHQTTVAGMEDQIQDLTDANVTLTNQLKEQTDANAEKDQVIGEIQQELAECQEALAKTGGVDESKLNAELLMHTETAAKTALFRTWKFIENEEDQINAATQLIPYLPVTLEIPEPEYITNYKPKVNDSLGKARQYVQSEGKKRAQGTQ